VAFSWTLEDLTGGFSVIAFLVSASQLWNTVTERHVGTIIDCFYKMREDSPQSFPPQSSAIVILCFVVQGLVLGPHLFIFYMADLADKVQQHQVEMHSFADDTQLYLYCHRDETTAAVTWLKTCLSGVRT